MLQRSTYLWSVMVIGIVVTAVGGTGIFAVFNDRATQGPNTVQSGTRPSAADIQISEFTPAGPALCGPWQEDLATALWNESNVQPGDEHTRYLCLKNNGSASISVTANVLDLVNSDDVCTGDEQSVDPGCGNGLGAGQLGDVLQAEFQVRNCASQSGTVTATVTLSSIGPVTVPIYTQAAPLSAGSSACLAIVVRYPSTASVTTVQAAQSDGVSWRFAFDAVAN